MKFTEFNFSDKVLEGIQKAGFTECMPVQAEVFQHGLNAKQDVTVQSRTGTGKTAAFLLTIFELFTRDPEAEHKALIIAPTRELAVQIEQEAKLLGKDLPYKIGSFYGGVGYKDQDKLLKEGVDIIIGTPGRLLDYAQSKKLPLRAVDILVIDEADRLFDMGFLPDLKKMMRQLVKPEQRQTMLFSATLGTRVAQLAWEYMNKAQEIVIDNDRVTVDEITQELYHTSNHEKMQLLLGLLKREEPENALIFSNTKDMAVKLAKRLTMNGYQAEYIMGDLAQNKRQAIINRIKEGKLEILVATDVAARGLHINDLDLVINYDIPEDPENYVHRIGRTARAGKSGKAISLACEKYVYGLEAIHEFIGIKIPTEWADESLLNAEDKSKGKRVTGLQPDRSSNSRSGGQNRRGSGSSGSSNRRSSPSSSRSTSRRKAPAQDRPAHPIKNGTTGESANKTSGARKPGPQRPATEKKPAARSTQKPGPQAAQKQAAPAGAKPSKSDDLESRLEYYRKKYGEDFELVAGGSSKNSETKEKKKKQPNILQRLFQKNTKE
ncbi:MAG: DEAD/DEAH box helicase [Spirochaetaceae bacterium]|nr:DEAD/DEAH box helicase [Spirochaetaceae bacterium]MCF7950981.1 DEAD/DEAH box helicase [Spirochaetaceae bacterium]